MMVENNSYMFVTGPNVVKTVTHEDVTSEELGGAITHATKSGVTHFTCGNGVELINKLRNLMSYIPQNCEEQAPSVLYEPADESRPGLDSLIPETPNQPYDMHEVIQSVTDI
jgi:propionyl-CoA carboxylase beta chain